ncbi:hypothetical protein NL676_029354 [Syzygium grande]|nr:hypothetical protein NL676_029354 [Syzygium grande]
MTNLLNVLSGDELGVVRKREDRVIRARRAIVARVAAGFGRITENMEMLPNWDEDEMVSQMVEKVEWRPWKLPKKEEEEEEEREREGKRRQRRWWFGIFFVLLLVRKKMKKMIV